MRTRRSFIRLDRPVFAGVIAAVCVIAQRYVGPWRLAKRPATWHLARWLRAAESSSTASCLRSSKSAFGPDGEDRVPDRRVFRVEPSLRLTAVAEVEDGR